MTTQQTTTSNVPVWFITGTSNGMGLALASLVLLKGHHVISTSRHAEPHELLKTQNKTGSLHHVQLDLSSPDVESIKSVITQMALPIHNRIDILVNMAGYTYFGPLETLTPDTLLKVFRINAFTPLYLIQALLPHFRTHKTAGAPPKTIVNVSSTQGLTSDPSEAAYDSSKHALESLSEVLSWETHNSLCNNIRTLIVEPGAFRTNLVGGSNIGSSSVGGDGSESTDLIAPYSDTNHPVRKRMDMVAKYGVGAAKGDPMKAASVIFDAVMGIGEAGSLVRDWEVTEEGRAGSVQRLILGPDAWVKLDKKVGSLRRNVDATKNVAHGTNFDT